MVWKPDVTVAALIESDGRFLLVEERIRGRLVFNQPAGHLEDGESLIDAVIRETREETAWHFAPQSLLGIYQWRSPQGRSTVRFAFSGSVTGHDPAQPLDAPVVAIHWLTREQVLERAPRLRSPLVLRCIDDHLRGVRLPLSAVNSLETVAR